MQGQIYIEIFEFLFVRCYSIGRDNLRFQEGFKHYYSTYAYLSLSRYSTG